MTFRTIALSLTAATALLAGPSHAGGHEGAELPPAVKARQAYMSLNGFYLGQAFAMGSGKMEYDAEAAMQAARNLDTLTDISQAAFWPAGTDSDSIEGTRALPKIWEDFAGISQKGQDFAAATDKLVAVAGDGPEALLAAAKEVGGTCSACHKAYRVPDE